MSALERVKELGSSIAGKVSFGRHAIQAGPTAVLRRERF